MAADFAVIPEAYDRAANLEYPGGVRALSFDGADRFWMGLRAVLPDCGVQHPPPDRPRRSDDAAPRRPALDAAWQT